MGIKVKCIYLETVYPFGNCSQCTTDKGLQRWFPFGNFGFRLDT